VIAAVRLYREGLADALARAPRVGVVGMARSVPEAAAQLAAHKPDVILLSAPVDSAPPAVRRLRAIAPGARVIALAVREVDQEVVAWAEAGVDAFVTHDVSLRTLVDIVETAARGELLCTPRTAGALLRRVRARAQERSLDGPATSLTQREREIAELIVGGLSNKEIAMRLQIDVPTVKNHVHHILEKLGVTRRAQAAAHLRMLG
jgi:two-component system, NarL family, nitrate/nitrite response regulator NarL